MLPMVRGHWGLRGIILSLAPTAFQLLYVFPRQAGQGLFGLGLGALTPVFMLTRLPAASTSATARPPWFPLRLG